MMFHVYRNTMLSSRPFVPALRRAQKMVYTTQNESKGSLMDSVVGMVNRSFEAYPRHAIAGMFAMELLSIYGTHKLIVMSGVHIPPEFAVAFALGRPLRRLRFPVEVLGAAGLCRIVPQLKKIQFTTLFAGAAPSSLRSSITGNETLKMGTEKLGKVLDQYGAAYFISARWVGVAVVMSFYSGIAYGFDVTGFLEKYGIEQAGTVLASWALAVSTSSVLYPCTIVLGAGMAPVLGRVTGLFGRFVK